MTFSPILRLVAALWIAILPLAANALPVFTIQEYQEVDEGDSGLKNVPVRWTLSAPSSTPVRFTWYSQDGTYGPYAGVDFVGIPPTQVTIPAGQTSGELIVQIIGEKEVEAQEIIFLHFHAFVGAVSDRGDSSRADARIRILNDDEHPVPPLTGNDDHVGFLPNSGWVTIHPEMNDIADPELLRAGTLTLTSQPQHGEVMSVDRTNAIADLAYRPEPDFTGRDEFGYRLCKTDGQCVEAKVILQGHLKEAEFTGHSGRVAGESWQLSNLPALADARYLTSTLATPTDFDLVTTIDGTPHLTWDSRSGLGWVVRTIPASPAGRPVEHRIHAVSMEAYDVAIDLLVGIDTDGDGAPSADEQRCFAGNAKAINVANLRCELRVVVGPEPVTYWVAMHSREPTVKSPHLRIFHAVMDATASKLVATGPATVGRLAPFWTTLSWNDPTAIARDQRLGYVRIVDGDRVVGDFRVDVHGGESSMLLPQDGTPVTLDLPDATTAWWSDRRIFFDVPAGATSLTLSATSDRAIEFQLAHHGFADTRDSMVSFGPDVADANFLVTTPGQARTTTVHNPGPGRWYAVVRNRANQRARIQLSATLQGRHAAIRPGSYFNRNQPGSGLILYPAGDQWAGLWYTYRSFGRATWYYLQAPKPGADGIWRSPVYRNAWNGAEARSTQVGELTIAPTDVRTDHFVVSYVIDGYAGSQQMDPLGRGCPVHAGAPVDISSHWFDPARSGTGYSVQMWKDYEFFAAFMYDQHGEPLFLAAESPVFAGGEADLALEILQGTCPTCSYGPLVRHPAGFLRRTLVDGMLSEIQLDVDYADTPPLQGRQTWTVTDRVRTLGGPGTTQGCEP